MRTGTVLTLLLLAVVTPAFAVDTRDCARSAELASLYGPLASLHRLRSMVIDGAGNSRMEEWIDDEIETLREPRPDGSYRWVRWVRPDRDAPVEKKAHVVSAVQGSGSDRFESGGGHAFAARVAVPSKRSLFKGNNPVYVGKVRMTFTVDGRSRTRVETIDAWMNPDTSRTFDLGTISDRADVSVDASVRPEDAREAVVEIQFLQAVPQDDPDNPAWETITTLQRLRGELDPRSIDAEIARAERRVFSSASETPLATLISDLRKADALARSKKPEDQEKGKKQMEEVLKRLR